VPSLFFHQSRFFLPLDSVKRFFHFSFFFCFLLYPPPLRTRGAQGPYVLSFSSCFFFFLFSSLGFSCSSRFLRFLQPLLGLFFFSLLSVRSWGEKVISPYGESFSFLSRGFSSLLLFWHSPPCRHPLFCTCGLPRFFQCLMCCMASHFMPLSSTVWHFFFFRTNFSILCFPRLLLAPLPLF